MSVPYACYSLTYDTYVSFRLLCLVLTAGRVWFNAKTDLFNISLLGNSILFNTENDLCSIYRPCDRAEQELEFIGENTGL